MGSRKMKPSEFETIKSLLEKNVDFDLIEKLTGFSTWTIRRVKSGEYDAKFLNPVEDRTENGVVETLLNQIIENQKTMIMQLNDIVSNRKEN